MVTKVSDIATARKARQVRKTDEGIFDKEINAFVKRMWDLGLLVTELHVDWTDKTTFNTNGKGNYR